MRNVDTPIWMQTGWLPELELVNWPRLDRLREEHAVALGAHRAAQTAPERARARFAREDEDAREAALARARGEQEKPTEVASEIERAAELQVAEEHVATAHAELRAVVDRTCAELQGNDEEVQAAIAAARERAGIPKHDPDANPEPIEVGSEEERLLDQRRRADDQRYARARRSLDRDLSTLRGLFSTRLAQADTFSEEIAA